VSHDDATSVVEGSVDSNETEPMSPYCNDFGEEKEFYFKATY
jgi:hypothetical protein